MLIISGPSTIGKNPLIYKACEIYGLNYVVPYTTRTARCEEENGKDYYFLSKSGFQAKIQNKEMKEWDYCLDNYYGYSSEFLDDGGQITHGLSRMALRIKAKYPDQVTTVFLMPDNKDLIFNNLKKIYEGKALLLREALVEEELCHSVMFDKIFVVSNSVYDVLNEKEMKQLLTSAI